MDSINTPDFRPDEKNILSVYKPFTPATDLPSPSIQFLLGCQQSPLSEIQVTNSLAEVETLQEEQNDQQLQTNEFQENQFNHLQMNEMYAIAYEPTEKLVDPFSPGRRSNSTVFKEINLGGQFTYANSVEEQTASPTDRSVSSGSGKRTTRLSRAQQLCQMNTKKRDLCLQTRKLRQRITEYELARKEIQEKLLRLIQMNAQCDDQVF